MLRILVLSKTLMEGQATSVIAGEEGSATVRIEFDSPDQYTSRVINRIIGTVIEKEGSL